MLKDGQGRDIDFKNTLILMTSNAGSDLIEQLCADPETAPDAAGMAEALRPELLKAFKPAFLGRVTVAPFLPLPPEVIREIVDLSLARVAERFVANYGARLSWSAELAGAIAARCTESQSGARNIENILSQTVTPELSALILQRLADGAPVGDVRLGVRSDGGFTYDFGEPGPAPAAATPSPEAETALPTSDLAMA